MRQFRTGSAHVRRGFTLIELLLVVLILGLLAAIVIPQFWDTSDEAKQQVFMADLRTFAEAAMVYEVRTGLYLENSGSGQLPAGFADYIEEQKWLQKTPIGGVWDSELNSFGIKSALGVHFWAAAGGPARNDAFMQMIDQKCDDGNLATGNFRKLDTDRYYWIIADAD